MPLDMLHALSRARNRFVRLRTCEEQRPASLIRGALFGKIYAVVDLAESFQVSSRRCQPVLFRPPFPHQEKNGKCLLSHDVEILGLTKRLQERFITV